MAAGDDDDKFACGQVGAGLSELELQRLPRPARDTCCPYFIKDYVI